MTLSAAMSNALSGLTVAARAAELVSSNISNALTEGYGRRELVVQARALGGSGQGAMVAAVRRHSDPVVTGDRRLAEAGAADRQVRATGLARIEAALGSPEDAGSLTARIAAFDAALVAAAGRPESQARLGAVADAARAVAGALNAASAALQEVRAAADAGIARDVAALNEGLRGVAEFNTRIMSLAAGGRDASALIDQRQQLIDGIAAILPLREIARENGRVALYTAGGAMLLDGVRPAQVGFQPVGVIVPEMTLASGALSGITLDGRPVAGSGLAGGSLAANFVLRDDLGPRVQADLDALARDLAERFQPGPDATLAMGAPGLFTDLGAAVDLARETGLAARLRLNAAADPEQGGEARRLRDGLGSATAGAPGDPSLLVALQAALGAARPTASGAFAGPARGLADLAAQVLSSVAQRRVGAEAETSFAAARAGALKVAELQGGVDTDRELQDLLVIERMYGANARVVQAADSMIRQLLEGFR